MNSYEVILRLILAVIIGGAVGYEREFKNRPAGFRTNILVCLGAAVISMIQLYEVESTKTLIFQHPELMNVFKADIGRLDSDEPDFDAELLQLLIDQLPQGYRTVLVMFAIEGYSHKEIAVLLGITENTSRSQLFKARKQLEEQLALKKENRL